MPRARITLISLFKAALALCGAVCSTPGAIAGLSQNYPTYQDVSRRLEVLARLHPESASLVDVGPSDSGRTIRGLRIGSGPVHHLIVAAHHGWEFGSTEVAMAAAEDLVASPIAGRTIFVVPVLNISGFDADDRYEKLGDEFVDPNRDYPGPCKTDPAFRLQSTASLARFIEENGIVATASLHTYHPAVVYPWGFSTPDLETSYTPVFRGMVEAATRESGYPTGNSTELVYGADGTFDDYAFWKHGIWAVLFELGDTHVPTPDEVRQWSAVNVPGIRRMLEQAPDTRAPDHDFRGRCGIPY